MDSQIANGITESKFDSYKRFNKDAFLQETAQEMKQSGREFRSWHFSDLTDRVDEVRSQG
jgi:hypothetical protein